MKKRTDFLVTAVFLLFLVGMAAVSLVLPDRSFSEMENRNLRPVPELTAKRFTSGRYMTEAEEYVSDQILFRDTWVAMKALGERITGKRENNGIYFAAGDTLIRRIEEPDPVLLGENIDTLNAFANETDVPIFFGLIPSAASLFTALITASSPAREGQIKAVSVPNPNPESQMICFDVCIFPALSDRFSNLCRSCRTISWIDRFRTFSSALPYLRSISADIPLSLYFYNLSYV